MSRAHLEQVKRGEDPSRGRGRGRGGSGGAAGAGDKGERRAT
ncbi:hypothetical protein AAH979_30830 [Plantactinospora sp. ZYX-F-223]